VQKNGTTPSGREIERKFLLKRLQEKLNLANSKTGFLFWS